MTDMYRAAVLAYPSAPPKPTVPSEPTYKASDVRRAVALVAARSRRHNVSVVHGTGRTLRLQCECKATCEDVERATAVLLVGIRHGHSLGVEDERANRFSFETFSEAVRAIGRKR